MNLIVRFPRSVKLEFGAPVAIFSKIRLLILAQDVIPEDQIVHLRTHEASVGIEGRTDQRLPTHIERCVYYHRATGPFLEGTD